MKNTKYIGKQYKNWFSTLPSWKKKIMNRKYGNPNFWDKKVKYEWDEVKEKVKKPFQKASIMDVLKLLNSCYLENRNVKREAYHTKNCGCEKGCYYCGYSTIITTVDYTLRNKMYMKKSKMIGKAIKWIKDNSLPMKYGKNNGIVYFCYLGKQISFHDPKDSIHCKKYNGLWNGIVNNKIPFIIKKQKNYTI